MPDSSAPKPLALVRIALLVACGAGVTMGVLVPTSMSGWLHFVPLVVYLIGMSVVGVTFAVPWARRHAREIVIVSVYLLTGTDLIANALSDHAMGPMWVVVIALGGAISVGAMAWTTRVLGYYLAFQLAIVLAVGTWVWPHETHVSVMGGLLAIDALALVLTHNRMTSEWALRRAIASLRKHEAELEAALYRSEEASRIKSAILAAMSHEIRTPLTGVIGYSALLSEELDGSSTHTDSADLARFIQRGGERLLRTFDSMLNVARLEADKIHLDLKPVDVAELVRHTVSPYAAAAHTLSVRVDTPNYPVRIETDAEALRCALEHLVHNAITYTPIGGVTVELIDTPESIEIGVLDTGPGIEPHLLQTLFEPFRQASEGHDRAYEGVGLGLTLARQLAEALGGEIAVDSTVGQGSRFVLRLPHTAERSIDDELARRMETTEAL